MRPNATESVFVQLLGELSLQRGELEIHEYTLPKVRVQNESYFPERPRLPLPVTYVTREELERLSRHQR
jgi:hypothetical protein